MGLGQRSLNVLIGQTELNARDSKGKEKELLSSASLQSNREDRPAKMKIFIFNATNIYSIPRVLHFPLLNLKKRCICCLY